VHCKLEFPATMRKLCKAMEIAAQKPANDPIP
jgi:hypothetical protein